MTADPLMVTLFEYFQFHSMKRLSKSVYNLYFNENFDEKDIKTNTQLLAKVLPDFNIGDTVSANRCSSLQMLVLCRDLHEQFNSSMELIHNYNGHSCIKWSYNQLNLVIASMAMISRFDKQFFDLKTSESFKFVNLFYQLKALKVLSFLAIEPSLPLELLSVVVSQTFLWTEPTERDGSVMEIHSRLISQFSNCVRDRHSFESYLKNNFLFKLRECLQFVCDHFHSLIEYLTKVFGRTQIDLILDNWDQIEISHMQSYPNGDKFINFFSQVIADRSLLQNEDFLMQFVVNCQSN